MKISTITLISAFFISNIQTIALANTTTSPPVEHFAKLPTLKDIDLSPSGNRFIAAVAIDNVYTFSAYENTPEGVKLTFVISETDKFAFKKAFWGNEDRILFSIDFADKRYRIDTTETRLLSMNFDGSDMKGVFREWDNDRPVQIQDKIVSHLRNDPEHILVQYRRIGAENFGVYKAKIAKKARHATIERGKKDITSWQADTDGNIRIGYGVVDDKYAKLIIKMADGKWKDFSHRQRDDTTFDIDSISDNPNIFYVTSNHEGGTDGLYEYDITTDTIGKKLYKNNATDVLGAYQDAETGKALGAIVSDDEIGIYWFENTLIRKHLKALQKYFEGQSVSFRSVNDQKTDAVVFVEGRSTPGELYLYDMKTNQIDRIGVQYPELKNVAMGEIFKTSYSARDGLDIPASITLPPGMTSLEEAKNLKFVILPHGGPGARDFLGFDFWTQFLASRGYGILQMNFRGSTGYGEKFRAAGDQEWGQAMQDDITDGAKWLVSKGYADKDKMVIMGASYGGYAALMGAVKTPDLYQCAISFAGVADLPALLRDARKYVNGKYRTRHIGNLWKSLDMLKENSPVMRTTDVQIPILLMHGEDDRVVDVSQSKKMHRRLKKSGKDVTYFEFEEGDHYLSLYRNRLKFLQETEKFLGKCTG